MSDRVVGPAPVGVLSVHAVIGLATFALTQFFWSRTLGIVPQAINWFDDVVAVGLGVLALTRAPRPSWLSRAWSVPLTIFVVVALTGALANAVPLGRAVLGLRGVLIYLPVYYALVQSNLDRQHVKRILAAVFVIALAQLPLQFLEFALGVARVGFDFSILDDIAVGTFGPGMANAMGLFMIPFVCLGVGLWLTGRGRQWLVYSTVFAACLVLSSGRAAMMMLPVFLLWMAAQAVGWRRLASPRNLVALVTAGAVIVASADVYYRVTSGAGFLERLSPSVLLQEQVAYSPKAASRLAYYPITFQVLATEAASPWIGLGPGNYASGAGYLTNAPGLNLIRDVFGQWETGRETALNSQFLTSLGEFGIVGVLAFYAMIGLLVRRTLAVYRKEQDRLMRVALIAIAIAQMVFVVGTLVEPVWEDQVLAFPFWLGSALVTKLAESSSSSTAGNAISMYSTVANSLPKDD